jgi:anti-anti-sigma regulatory factor
MPPISYVVMDEVAFVVVSGPLDGSLAPAAHAALGSAIAAGARRVVVDLTATPGVDEGGLAVLAAAAADLGRHDGLLVLALPGGRSTEVADAGALRAALEH